MATLPGWKMHLHCHWLPLIDSFAYSDTSVSMAGAVDGVLVCIQTWICIPPQLWCCCSWCTQPVAYRGCRALMALACCSGSTWSLGIWTSPHDIPCSWAGFHLLLTCGRGAPGLIPCARLTWGPASLSSRWIPCDGLMWAIWQCTWRPHGGWKDLCGFAKMYMVAPNEGHSWAVWFSLPCMLVYQGQDNTWPWPAAAPGSSLLPTSLIIPWILCLVYHSLRATMASWLLLIMLQSVWYWFQFQRALQHHRQLKLFLLHIIR